MNSIFFMGWRHKASLFLVLTIAIAFLLPVATAATHIDPIITARLQQNSNVRVIIVIDNNIQPQAVASILSNPATTLNSNNYIAAEVTKSELEQLKSNPNVKGVYYDDIVKVSLDASANKIGAKSVWPYYINNKNITGAGQTVCVIDTGINYTHPALGGCFGDGCKVVDGYDFTTCSEFNATSCVTSKSRSSNVLDDQGHGSHIAGIVASSDATYKGIAPNASLMAIKSLNSQGLGWTSDVIAGLNWCTGNATTYTISSAVMSLSTTTLYSTACDANSSLTTPIDDAVAAGILVAVAAGNDYDDTSIGSPACVTSATSVGATDDNDARADYSNIAAILDLFAPGSSIKSVDYDSSPSAFTEKSGTSMAAPHVAAVAALIQQYENLEGNVTQSPSYIQNLLRDTGLLLSVEGFDIPRIDILAAIRDIDDTPAEINNFKAAAMTTTSAYVTWEAESGDYNFSEVYFDDVWQTNTTDFFYLNDSLEEDTDYVFKLISHDDSNNTKEFELDVYTGADAITPNITLNSPENASIISETDTIDFDVYDDDSDISYAWYSLDGGTTNITFADTYDISASGWADTEVLNVWANDTWNNLDYELYEFTISNALPIIESINPNATVVKGIINFNVTVTDDDGQADIELVKFYALNDSTWVLIGNDTTATDSLYSAPFDSTLLIDGNTTLRVNATDGSSDVLQDVTITIDNINAAPVVAVTKPNGGETVEGTYAINWTASDADNDTLSYDVSYFIPGASTQTIICNDIAVKTCSWSTTSVTNGDSYRINVTAADGSHFVSDQSDANFTISNSGGSEGSGSEGGGSGEVSVPSAANLAPSSDTNETQEDEIVQIAAENSAGDSTTSGSNLSSLTGAFSLDNLRANPTIAVVMLASLAAAIGALAFFMRGGGGSLPKFNLPQFESPANDFKKSKKR